MGEFAVNAASIVAMVGALVDAAREAPQVVSAIEGVFRSLAAQEDPTPALKELEAAAAAHELGIPWP